MSSKENFRCYFVAVLLVGVLNICDATLKARAWQSSFPEPDFNDFPEREFLSLKSNTAIGFTGGGSRSFVASLGYLGGLLELDLLKNIRYIAGISGGSWATAAFSYVQNVDSDEIFLGAICPPEKLTLDNVKLMDENCGRRLAANNLTFLALSALKDGTVDSFADGWALAVSTFYLEPLNIFPSTLFSWNEGVVSDIKARNPDFENRSFILPRSNRPFPVLGFTIVGPTEGGPYKADTQNYTLLEVTPLYVGQLRSIDVEYKYSKGQTTETITIGGAIEPFAFGRVTNEAASVGLGMRSTAVLNVPDVTNALDLKYAAAASGYAPGSVFESLSPEALADALAMNFDYWSPSPKLPQLNRMYIADGGIYENVLLISFLQRRVSKIVLFFNSNTPLLPSSSFNPYTDIYHADVVDAGLACFFGIFDQDEAKSVNRTVEYNRDQVFSTDQWPVVISALQASQLSGRGTLASFNLTTIENSWWGIPAGITVDITFVYLGRAFEWEARLNREMRTLLVPHDHTEDPSVDIDHGPFRKFPHYVTAGGGLDYARANVLADLCGWTITSNRDVFQRIFE
jgi:hypothetical protein